MGKIVKVRVTREVLSNTATGIKSEETFRFPLDKEVHHIEMMELKTDFQVISYNEQLTEANIKTSLRELKYEKDGFMNYVSKKINDRFLFFVYFELVNEDYSSKQLDGYELLIEESIFRRDTYTSHEDKKQYILPIELYKELDLKLIGRPLIITGIDANDMKVLITIKDEEVVVASNQPGEYNRGGQSGYNDSFEAWTDSVIITLKKK